jgi:hypothetical protein
MACSVWLRFPRVFGGPALAERHAVTHEVSAIFKLPVRYYDWSGIMAHFPVSAAAVRELLPTNKLKPVPTCARHSHTVLRRASAP